MNKKLTQILFSILLGCSVSAFASQPMFNVDVVGSSLDITSVADHTYKSAGIKINNPSEYALAGIGTECTMASSDYCIFTVSNKQNKILTLTGETGDLDITLCLDGYNPVSCQKFNDLPVQIAKYLYVVDYYFLPTSGVRGGVWVCPLDNDGNIEDCYDAGGGVLNDDFYLQGIVLNNDSTIAYLTSGDAIPYVFQCSINPADGTFYPCDAIGINSVDNIFYGTYYGMLGLNSSSSIAYLPDYNGGTMPTGRLLACPIDNGNISGAQCVDTGATTIIADGYAVDVILNNKNTTAYISNYNPNPNPGNYNWISVCDVDNFNVKACSEKIGGYVNDNQFYFEGPGQMTFNASESLLYIVDKYNLYACEVESTQQSSSFFNECTLLVTKTDQSDAYWGLALNVIDANTSVVYISDYDTTVQTCITDTSKTSNFVCNSTLNIFSGAVGLAIGY